MSRIVRDTSLILAGSAALYIAMVSCSADSGAAGGPGHSQGSGGFDAGGLVDALRDVFSDVVGTDVVRDANAQGPTSVNATCNIQIPGGAAINTVYAEAAFPGKTVEQLANAHVIMQVQPNSQTGAVASYTHTFGTGGLLKTGSIAVYCGVDNSPGVLNRQVTVILP